MVKISIHTKNEFLIYFNSLSKINQLNELFRNLF